MSTREAREFIAHALLSAFQLETHAPDDMIAMLAAIAAVPPPTSRAPAPPHRRSKR